MILNEMYLALIGVFSAAATGFTGWFFGRKKTQAEVVNAQIDNDIKLSKHYREMLDDLKKRYIEQFNEFEEMTQQKIHLYEEQIKFLEKKIRILQQENKELRSELKRLKTENANLISASGGKSIT